jgi:hypothetical protein
LTLLVVGATLLSDASVAAATSASTTTSSTASTSSTSTSTSNSTTTSTTAGSKSTKSNSKSNSKSRSKHSTAGGRSLESVMLGVPLPGLVDFVLVGPGATNGVLTAQTLGSYSTDPTQTEQEFDQYSSQSGFAGWIKTWQDASGTNQLVEIAIRFHDAGEASSNAAAFVTALSRGLANGTRASVPSIRGAAAFIIDEPASKSGNSSIPAQQVQAVVFSDANYFVALHSDSPNGPGTHPIAVGTVVALALQQYQNLSSVLPKPPAKSTAPAPTKSTSNGPSAFLVGVGLLVAVVVIIVVVAYFTRRRARKAGTRKQPPATKQPRPETAATPTTASTNGSGKGDRRHDRPAPAPASPPAPAAAASSRVNGASKRGAHAGRLGGVGVRTTRGPRSQRLTGSRKSHPSAALALAEAKPADTTAGWYDDPSDTDHRRIRYWDGNTWTNHVAEPEP